MKLKKYLEEKQKDPFPLKKGEQDWVWSKTGEIVRAKSKKEAMKKFQMLNVKQPPKEKDVEPHS